MSNTIRIEVPKAKNRNPLFMGGRGSGGHTFRNKRDKRAKDRKNSWQADIEKNG